MSTSTAPASPRIPGLADLPPDRPDPDALHKIRRHNTATAAWIVVLDDDPTGAQAVHDVTVLIEPTVDDFAATARNRQPVFVWTNSRSLSAASATEINRTLVLSAIDAANREGARPIFVSRSDSILRGHFATEISAIGQACSGAGRAVDGVVFVPAFIEAGRFTAGDVQWVAQPDGDVLPASRTEFARDATFGYSEDNLRDWVAARVGLRPDQVRSMPLGDVRGDPGRIERIVRSLSRGEIAIGNAVTAGDLEALVLACQAAERAGRHLIHRCGPSFVRALLGQESRVPLTTAELAEPGEGFGLTVVGSHTALTTRQLEEASRHHQVELVELDVDAMLGDGLADVVNGTTTALESAMRCGHTALVTSRTLRTAVADPQESLAIARRVSSAVCAVIAGLPPDLALRYVVAKGGITSHDVAVNGLGIRHATVLGQMFPGQVSVLRLGPETARPGMPYVVFPGNVGAPDSLARVIAAMDGTAPC